MVLDLEFTLPNKESITSFTNGVLISAPFLCSTCTLYPTGEVQNEGIGIDSAALVISLELRKQED